MICCLCSVANGFYVLRMPNPRVLYLTLVSLGLGIYFAKYDSECEDLALVLLPSLCAMMDLRPIFVSLLFTIEYLSLPESKSFTLIVLTLLHCGLYLAYITYLNEYETDLAGEEADPYESTTLTAIRKNALTINVGVIAI